MSNDTYLRAELEAAGMRHQGIGKLSTSKRARRVRLLISIVASFSGISAFVWGVLPGPSTQAFPTPLTAHARSIAPRALLSTIAHDDMRVGLLDCAANSDRSYSNNDPISGDDDYTGDDDFAQSWLHQAQIYISLADVELNHGNSHQATQDVHEANVIISRVSRLGAVTYNPCWIPGTSQGPQSGQWVYSRSDSQG
jgi:hypothetical protein